ncbi:MAG: glycoside hydrolase family 5 protein [Lachnospiraceae bacterium]|nr:glycoside hydrolase family 5 protein [Lachnospiraceae bacterium]
MKTKYDRFGALHVDKNGKLVDRNGTVVALHGYSTHGLSWYPEYVNREFLEYMKDEWHIDCIRLAMYTAEEDGYCVGDDSNRKKLIEVVDRGVKAATELGLYVIIDWHILEDSNPLMHKDLAKEFFKIVSERYAAYGNVFYEICNEPNVNCTWSDVKAYAEEIIPVIRANDKYSVIFVGTPKWSQRLDEACADPVTIDDNIMYSLHFYAGTHKEELRQIYRDAIAKKLPVFVTEFGTCAADGAGDHFPDESKIWLDLLDQNDTGYMMWNISNRDETSASFVPECMNYTGPYEDSDLREPARWYRDVLCKLAQNS